MRVLHVYSGNLFGGIEAMLLAMARQPAAAAAGLESEFALCFDARLSAELEAAGARVHRLGEVRVSRPATVHRARRALKALIASKPFDRVICHASWSHAIFGGPIRRTGVPLVVWAHDVLDGTHWTERWARRTPPDLAICNSRFTAASVVSTWGSAPHPGPVVRGRPLAPRRSLAGVPCAPGSDSGVPLVVVHPPAEISQPELSAADRDAVRAELATPTDAIVIVQVSRMEAWKGHALLIDALARLRQRQDWICWQIGGAQRPREAAYLDSLRDRARELQILDRVRFAGQRHDVARLLRAADLHCQPNTRPEPFGVAFVEALAAGLPVVTTAIGGALEIVDHSCGMVVPPSDAAALSEALDRLSSDASLRARLGARARVRAHELSDPATQLHRLREALVNMPMASVRA
jgi:glycosyltransferase involved in cell wall biosynthesis